MHRTALLLALLLPLPAHAAPDAAACVAVHGSTAQGEGAEAARAVFRQCALREYGASAEPRIEACTADLYTLPVILLYRSDGLSRAEALADMKRDAQLDDGSDEARRAPRMLDFAYQGAGPVAGKSEAWIRQRVNEWTDRCLRGLVSK